MPFYAHEVSKLSVLAAYGKSNKAHDSINRILQSLTGRAKLIGDEIMRQHTDGKPVTKQELLLSINDKQVVENLMRWGSKVG